MLDTFLLVAAGAFIGWNMPQPFWAKYVQKRATDWWNTKFKK